MEVNKSKILIIGATGYIGKFIVEASVNAGHSTYAFVRETTVSDPTKAMLIKHLKSCGVDVVFGDLNDHESLVRGIKLVDVVISAVGHLQLQNQIKIIAAIKEAGNVKRFLPSEFGNDRNHAVEPGKSVFAIKSQIRRAIEAEGIPYSYISCNLFFSGYFLPSLGQLGVTAPPRCRVLIRGDGNAKAIYTKEEDIGTYTIKAVDDPRTLNKTLYMRLPGNIYSANELVSLWEKKIGKSLEKIYVSEEQVLKHIKEAPYPENFVQSIGHSIYVKGDQTNFEIEPGFGVEALKLYPEVKYTTVDQFLDQFV